MKFENYEKAAEIFSRIDYLKSEIDTCKLMIADPSEFCLSIDERQSKEGRHRYGLDIDKELQYASIRDIATKLLAKHEQEVKELIAEFERIE